MYLLYRHTSEEKSFNENRSVTGHSVFDLPVDMSSNTEINIKRTPKQSHTSSQVRGRVL